LIIGLLLTNLFMYFNFVPFGFFQIQSIDYVWIDRKTLVNSRTSNIESNKSQNGGLEDYNNISDGIFPHITTPSIKLSLG
jgi:hypothetical protein